MRIAFYAPMKPLDDHVPSGDRTMARAFVAAMFRSGHRVEMASRLRTHLHAPDRDRQDTLAGKAEQEAETITAAWVAAGPPDLWFTYHNYHKAPDLLGPRLSRRFGLPYAVAEGSHAAKRAATWAGWFAAAEAANRAADLHVCMTARDRESILPLLGAGAELVTMPPFIDLDDEPQRAPSGGGRPVRLVTVAMMREGDKLESYRFLAAALATLPDGDWHLDIVGDGQARAEVQAAFAPIDPARVAWRGECGPADVRLHLAQADIFVWPGFGEAFGLAYLEAQAMAVPVVALDIAGVPSVVIHGRTGVLVSEPNPDAFGRAVASLAADPTRRDLLGRGAVRFVRDERSLGPAAAALDAALQATLARKRSHHVG